MHLLRRLQGARRGQGQGTGPAVSSKEDEDPFGPRKEGDVEGSPTTATPFFAWASLAHTSRDFPSWSFPVSSGLGQPGLALGVCSDQP